MDTFNMVLHWLQVHSILAMIAVVTAIMVATYLPSRKAEMQHDAMIPLNDDR